MRQQVAPFGAPILFGPAIVLQHSVDQRLLYMKRSLLLLSMLSAFAFNDLLAAPPSFIQTKDGVIVFTDPAFTGTSNAVKPEVISENIIRVTAVPLITVYTKRPDLFWNVIPTKDSLTLAGRDRSEIIVNLNIQTCIQPKRFACD